MIHVIVIPHFTAAIVALALLRFVLALDVGGRVAAGSITLSGAAAMFVGPHHALIFGTPLTVILGYFVFILGTIAALFLGNLGFCFSRATAYIFGRLLFMLRVPATRLFYHPFPISFIVPLIFFLAGLIKTGLTRARQSIIHAFSTMKKFGRGGLDFIAFCTLLMGCGGLTAAMSVDISDWFTSDPSVLSVIVFSDSGFLLTTALAIAVWNFVAVWSMIIHVGISLLDIGHAPGHWRVAGAFCSRATGVILAQGGIYAN